MVVDAFHTLLTLCEQKEWGPGTESNLAVRTLWGRTNCERSFVTILATVMKVDHCLLCSSVVAAAETYENRRGSSATVFEAFVKACDNMQPSQGCHDLGKYVKAKDCSFAVHCDGLAKIESLKTEDGQGS